VANLPLPMRAICRYSHGRSADSSLASLPPAGEFASAYEDPQSALARAYVSDLSGAAADADVRDLAAEEVAELVRQ
jgi:hypothetical protein